MEKEVTQRLARLETRLNHVETSVVDIADGQSELFEYMEDISSDLTSIRGSVEANRQAFLLLRAAQRDPTKSLIWIAFSAASLYIVLRLFLPFGVSLGSKD